MVEWAMRMASGGKCDTSLGEKLAGTFGRKSVSTALTMEETESGAWRVPHSIA